MLLVASWLVEVDDKTSTVNILVYKSQQDAQVTEFIFV